MNFVHCLKHLSIPGQVFIWFIVFSKLTLTIPSFVAHKRVPVCFLFMRVMCDTEIDWSSLSGAKTECRKIYLKKRTTKLYLVIIMVLLLREDAENTCSQNILGIFILITSLKIKFKTKE